MALGTDNDPNDLAEPFDPTVDAYAEPPGTYTPAKAPTSWSDDLLKIAGGAGGLATLFGTGLNAYSSIARGEALREAYDQNAQALEEQIGETRAAATADEHNRRRKLAETIAAQQALFASRGVILGEGSAQRASDYAQEGAEYDIGSLWTQVDSRTRQLRSMQDAYRKRGEAAELAGQIGAASQGLAGLGSASGIAGVTGLVNTAVGAIGVVDKLSGGSLGSAASAAGGVVKDAAGSAWGVVTDALADVWDWF
jgi:hypothetical protein